ncbi:NLR family CARD domain-containing protein 4-like [Stylophora pistillata]|uniref:NLR family CARD domain-containing protein 4-like n=1 Tax=Stylophora pistillata TaxID=50429 RepID=UPI000C04993C|nr:NLR family CARD domain-containing protein 4-like [Stylophora pistillata]XP_022790897.1 NLR family CARD domain-containing protein 4-like [Stylophora pistillata]
MTTISAYSKETTNYARLCRLLVDVGSQVLRDVFEKLRPPGNLNTVLNTPSVLSTLTSLKKRRVLYPAQWTKLTSSSVSSLDFDITLIAVLLRNICGLSPPATGWNTPPPASDTTEAADITRIKIYRNEVFAHAERASVDEVQFNTHWKNIKDPLVRLGGIKYDAIIDNLKTEGVDPEKEEGYQQLLKEWKEYEESVISEGIGEIKEQLGTFSCKIQKLEEKVDMMLPSAIPAKDLCLKDLRDRLEKLYNNLSQVRVTPWDPDNTVEIDEIYTELFWVRDYKKPRGKKQEKLDDYSNILKELKSNRILVYGMPGIGKSTFAKKIAIDWARGRKENLKKFDLLLMIPLRNVSNIKTFRNMLIEAKLFSAEDHRLVDTLIKYILEHKDKVLLVLDGYDEYSAGEETPFVGRLWMGEEFRECFVILTTRPIREDDVKRYSSAHFQIKGFDETQIKEFSMKFLDDEQEVHKFLDYIKVHKLKEIAEIPLLLLMLCLLWKEKNRKGLPEAKVYLYSEFIQTLFNHMAAKDADEEFRSIKSYRVDLEQVGELAFNALLNNSLELDYEHFPNELLSSKLIRVGVIQIVKVFSAKPKKMVAFLHKSFQEFLAAWFIIHKLLPSAKDNVTCIPVIDSTKKVVDLLEVLKFVCEWSPEGSKAVLQHLASLRKNHDPLKDVKTETPFVEDLPSNDKRLSKLSLECFITTPIQFKTEVYPSLLKSLTGVLIIPDTLLSQVADGHFVKSESLPESVFFDFQRRPSPEDRGYISSIMDDLNAVIVSASEETKATDFVRRQGKTDVLASLLVKRVESKMYLHFSQITNIDVGTLKRLAIPAPATFSQARISHEDREVGDRAAKMDLLIRRHCFSLAKKIDVKDLEGDIISVISNVLPFLGRPREIILRSTKESFASQATEGLVSGMNITECLKRLRLQKIGLTEKFLPVVANAFPKACNLQELSLSENPLGSSVRCLAANLRHVQQLTILELSNALMEQEAFSDLANALRHVPHLEELSVSRNRLGTSIIDLAENLEYVPELTRLDLRETHMDEEGGMAISDCLQALLKLELLDISHNPLGSAVAVIAENLCKATCLIDLNMADTKMGAKEATALASSLMYLQNLTTLSVGSNQLAQGVSDLVWHLSEKSKLKRLNMENVEMGEEEVDNVAKTCKKLQSLAIVNDYLDEKGESKKRQKKADDHIPDDDDDYGQNNFPDNNRLPYSPNNSNSDKDSYDEPFGGLYDDPDLNDDRDHFPDNDLEDLSPNNSNSDNRSYDEPFGGMYDDADLNDDRDHFPDNDFEYHSPNNSNSDNDSYDERIGGLYDYADLNDDRDHFPDNDF